MKEKVKSTPKELVRRGLDDGTERLRGQLRDTAQRGQADDYGGDQIEDPAASGARRAERGAERGIENLLKKKKAGRQEVSQGHAPSQEPPPPEPRPEGAPPPAQTGGDSRAADRPRIKTRDAVTAREGSSVPYDGGRLEPTPAAGSERQRIKIRESTVRGGHEDAALSPRDGPELPRIRTREAAVREAPASVEPAEQPGAERPQIKTRDIAARDVRANVGEAPQAALEPPPQIKTRETVTGTSPDHRAATDPPSGKGPSDRRLSIKTKDAYIQRQPAEAPEQPPQAFTQGQQGFAKEQGRRVAVKRAEAQRLGNGSVPQGKGGGNTASSVPVQRGHASSGRGCAPAHPLRQPVSPGNPDTRPAQKSGKTIVKTARSARKVPERTARHAIETVERSSRKTIKTAQRTAKTATRTAKTAGQTAKTAQKTAQATVKATQRAVQATRAAAKAAATTAKAAAKATIAAIKAAIAAIQSLVAAIAAGGWVAVVIILVICLVGLLIASPFGIFFSDGGSSPNAVSPAAAVAQINREYADTLSGYQTGGSYDSVEIVGRPPSWVDVFAVFSVKTVTGDNMDVVVLDVDRVERLRAVFWDMTKITTETKTVDHPATEDADAWTETVLVITITPRTTDDMRVFYDFTEEQNAALDELLTAESHNLWSSLLYGNSGEFVAVALTQVGNVGGQPYWSWYGFNSRVEWCACFVSWCANECGYIDAGVIPKFAGCTGGSNWFKNRGQWQDGSYEPRPGDLIFFDWDNKGSSGPQDDVPDHVGIVERVEDGVVYTVEGNSGDSCRQRSYSVGYYEIWGYGYHAF